MYALIFFATLVVSALAAPQSGYDNLELAKACNSSVCKLPNCRCASTDIPGNLKPSEVPQLVLLTFDDAVGALNIDYYRKAFAGRRNPDGCPIGSTYFVSHEYTDYSTVHELWAGGHEIALHSITHQTPSTYWKDLDLEGYVQEFGDQKKLLSKFANISEKDVQGIRLPFLQLAGNNSFEMIKKAGLKYDCSWPTLTYITPGLWPYTLDYKSIQDCSVGPCPTASLPGVWVVPMIDWLDTEGYACAMVDSCINIPEKVDELVALMIENFNRQYKAQNSNRAPFGFYVHAAWFGKSEAHFEAYVKFLDYLQGLKDVYLVGIQRALQWVQKPSTLNNLKNAWPSCQATHSNTCGVGKSCELKKGAEIRYMKTCTGSCPAVYPWIGNPLGEEK